MASGHKDSEVHATYAPCVQWAARPGVGMGVGHTRVEDKYFPSPITPGMREGSDNYSPNPLAHLPHCPQSSVQPDRERTVMARQDNDCNHDARTCR